MNIIIDAHSLKILGGVERFVCDLANNFIKKGHNVFLFINEMHYDSPIYKLDNNIQFITYSHNGRQSQLVNFKKQILNCNPDICISPAGDRQHIPWCVALQDTGIPLIVSEHSNPHYIHQHLWDKKERIAVMNAADGIHLLQSTFIQTLPDFLHDKICIIPNTSNIPILKKIYPSKNVILSIGRLHFEKQNSLLIEAFSLIKDNFPDWKIEIWGDGPDKQQLSKLINKLNLTDTAKLCGQTSNPEKCYAYSKILCLPSKCECFPLTIIEAMSAGIPCVGFAEASGVNQLIIDGKTGLLSPQMSALSLAKSLTLLMSNDKLYNQMAENAKIKANEYSPQKVYDIWEQFIKKVAKQRGNTQLLRITKQRDNSSLWNKILQHCMNRSNVLVGDGQWLRRFIFSMPYLKRLLHPDWVLYKNIIKKI